MLQRQQTENEQHVGQERHQRVLMIGHVHHFTSTITAHTKQMIAPIRHTTPAMLNQYMPAQALSTHLKVWGPASGMGLLWDW